MKESTYCGCGVARKWTDSVASEFSVATKWRKLRYINSVKNGVNGAMTRIIENSTLNNVWSAWWQSSLPPSPLKKKKEMLRIVQLISEWFNYLESFAVHSDVPIGKWIDKANQAWDDSVKTVCSHFLVDKQQQGLCVRENPPIHDVLRLVCVLFLINKFNFILLKHWKMRWSLKTLNL